MGKSQEAPETQPSLSRRPEGVPPDRRISVSYHCTLCDGEAGRVDVFAFDAAREWDVVLHGLVGETRLWVKREEVPTVMQALVEGAAATYRHDAEWASFYCPQCELAYCAKHWALEETFDDDGPPGWYDCTYGTCPAGHRRVVDD